MSLEITRPLNTTTHWLFFGNYARPDPSLYHDPIWMMCKVGAPRCCFWTQRKNKLSSKFKLRNSSRHLYWRAERHKHRNITCLLGLTLAKPQMLTEKCTLEVIRQWTLKCIVQMLLNLCNIEVRWIKWLGFPNCI